MKKVVNHITPLYKQWIEASRFVVLTTVGEEGCDTSPRGDQANVVKVVDEGFDSESYDTGYVEYAKDKMW